MMYRAQMNLATQQKEIDTRPWIGKPKLPQ
jgi:hypothetical protein